MVVKKSNIISIAIILGLSFVPVTFADSANNLVQLDLKRASNDAVNVTLFTTNNYNDNVMVRKKSDNKYVILIPKVQSSGFSASNLSGVRDLVSNVDVKTVNDTSGGYTKVTLITTKPLDIKTSSRKSAPVTQEQKDYQTLIAQANAVKNNVTKHDAPPKLREQKTEITVNKAPADKKIKQAEPKKVETQKPNIKLEEVDTEKLQRQTRKEHLAELVQEVKDEKIAQNVPDVVPEVAESATVDADNVQDISKIHQEQKVSIISKIKNKASKMPKKVKYAMFGILGLFVLSKMLKRSANSYSPQTQAYGANSAQADTNIDYDRVNNIIDNSELSWRDKYKMYLDKSAIPVSRGENKGNYTFIKTPNIQQNKKQVGQDKKRRQEKVERLERLVTPVNHETFNDIEPEIVESEDEVISKAIKLKAFEKRAKSLKMTSRDKSRFRKYEVEIPLHEQKNIELGDSMLHTNPRSLEGANLKITDVDKNRIKYEPKEYVMSSVDEYFSILDKEQEQAQQAQQPLQPLPQPKIETTPMAKPVASNPIARQKSESKSSYLKGLIVKSGFNIDDNKGFYLVSQDGQNALVGKVKDEIFVLKKFDKNVTTPIQVRHDNANVYMVKAGEFKSLVEVNDDKMGVLIEL